MADNITFLWFLLFSIRRR